MCVWAATILPGMASGLIIVHEPDFWRQPPPDFLPPRPIPPGPVPRPPRDFPPPRPAWAPLEVILDQVNVRIKDQIAVTSIEEEFYNPNPRQLEGTFLFPVPKGAQINKFTMEINGKQVEAELMTADKARGIYEDIVRRLQDPALLEYAGRDLFKVRIFPIEPNSKKRITLSYAQALKSDGGLVNFILPLNTEKFSARPIKTLSVKVDLETKRPLKSVYSPSHPVEVKRSGATRAVIGYEASSAKPDADFQLFYAQEEQDIGLNLMTFKGPGDEGFFLLLASPGAGEKNSRSIPKDITFVLDTSGSMAGSKLEQAKKALLFCVENLNDADRFEILRFSTEVEPLFDRLTEATRENRGRALKFIKDLKPTGGTAIDDALRKALAVRPDTAERPYSVIFLTDGRPTVGQTDENHIVETVAKSAKGNARIFCFGIGTDVNTHLLDRITEETKAFSQYVLPEEDIEVKVSSFFTKIKEPVLANLRLFFPEGIRATKLYPSPLPDLFKGEQLLVAGRYSGRGDGAIRIEGTVGGEGKKFAYDVTFAEEASDHEFIPRLWATRRVGYLLDEIRLRGESKELKDEVTELARKYSIVTPYTAYLILEDESQRRVPTAMRSLGFGDDSGVRQELSANYQSFTREKVGDRAVGGARSLYSLKSAQSASDAIAAGTQEASRGSIPASATPLPLAVPALSSPANGGGYVAARAPAARSRSEEYAEQSKYVNGRTFFQHDGQWVDSEIQAKPDGKRVRVQFGSAEYFELLKKNPKAQPWLALGRSLQVVIGQTIYEIYE